MVRFNLESISKLSGHCGEGGEGQQQMVMDGDQVHFLPLWEMSRCFIGRQQNRPYCRLKGWWLIKVRRGGALSPVCPGCSRVYDGRTPAVSPKPSSQTPGSYCFSPFGCPARGRDTDRYLYWGHGNHSISFPHCVPDILYRVPNHWRPISIFFSAVCAQIWVKISCWQNVASCKCLPPCFLLSSPFWSTFFGCSLGLWGCCEMKANVIKGKQQRITDWEENEYLMIYFYLGSWLLVRLITWK